MENMNIRSTHIDRDVNGATNCLALVVKESIATNSCKTDTILVSS